MGFKPPRICWDSQGKCSIVFYLNNRRIRIANGMRLSIDLHPNRFPVERRQELAEELRLKVHLKLLEGWSDQESQPSPFEFVVESLKRYEVSPRYVIGYQKAVNKSRNQFIDALVVNGWSEIRLDELNMMHCQTYLNQFIHSPSTYNHERKHLSAIVTACLEPLGLNSPVRLTKKLKEAPILHKPFIDVQAILADIKDYNEGLYLCCLLTYGCLLRPHREIRQLKWKDFTPDLAQISLSGSRNKSGRNRVVPVPQYVRKQLSPTKAEFNVFSGRPDAFHSDYFKQLWTRYKKQTTAIDCDQTLYSFRHSGAIEVYKRTGSLEVLQQAMGHATLAVTLGYLRNLELPQLTEDMMPSL